MLGGSSERGEEQTRRGALARDSARRGRRARTWRCAAEAETRSPTQPRSRPLLVVFIAATTARSCTKDCLHRTVRTHRVARVTCTHQYVRFPCCCIRSVLRPRTFSLTTHTTLSWIYAGPVTPRPAMFRLSHVRPRVLRACTRVVATTRIAPPSLRRSFCRSPSVASQEEHSPPDSKDTKRHIEVTSSLRAHARMSSYFRRSTSIAWPRK